VVCGSSNRIRGIDRKFSLQSLYPLGVPAIFFANPNNVLPEGVSCERREPSRILELQDRLKEWLQELR
jgi:hypothetical protein